MKTTSLLFASCLTLAWSTSPRESTCKELECQNDGLCCWPAIPDSGMPETCVCKTGWTGKLCEDHVETLCTSFSLPNEPMGRGDRTTCYIVAPPQTWDEARNWCLRQGDGWALDCPSNHFEHAAAIMAKRNMARTHKEYPQKGGTWFGYKATEESVASQDESSFLCSADGSSLAKKHYAQWNAQIGDPDEWNSFPTLEQTCLQGGINGLSPKTCSSELVGVCSKTIEGVSRIELSSGSLSHVAGSLQLAEEGRGEEEEAFFTLSNEDDDTPVSTSWDEDKEGKEEGKERADMSSATIGLVIGGVALTIFSVVAIARRFRRDLRSATLLLEEASKKQSVDEETANSSRI